MGSTEDMKNPGNEIISTTLVKRMKAWQSIAVLSLVLGCSVATAANPRATDAAFAALFSMPTAAPSEGKWIFRPEDDFTVRTEAGLIAYLREQKKQGADFNAYRHQGTLLHHAIRARLPATARWLLAYGGNPHLKLRDEPEDALQLSMKYEVNAITTLLQQKYGLIRPTPKPTPVVPPTPEQEANDIASSLAGVAIAPTALAKEIAAIPPQKLQRYSMAILRQMAFAARVKIDKSTGAMAYTIPAESWRILWRHLKLPLDYGEVTGLAHHIEPASWHDLVRSGYSPKAEDALGCLLAEIPLSQMKTLWPLMVAEFPNVRELASHLVLSGYRLGSGSSPCHQRDNAGILEKLAFLRSLRIANPVAGIDEAAIAETGGPLAAAIKPLIKKKTQGPARLVSAAPSCTFNLSDVWRKALTTKPGWKIETVQMLEVPGEAECAVLVSGSDSTYFPVDGLVDSFSGPYRDVRASCPDPTDAYQLWRKVGAAIIVSEPSLGHDDTMDPLIHVRDTRTGKPYYLNSGRQAGRCHLQGRFPFAYEWRAGQLVRSLPSEVENALFEQCSAGSGELACSGIAELMPNDAPGTVGDTWFNGMSLDRLLSPQSAPTLSPEARKLQLDRFVAAVMTLDRKQLASYRTSPLPSEATAAAITAVSKSNVSLPDKRKRIAWLFYDHGRLADAFDNQWPHSLLAWLPYEDWTPVMKAIATFGPTSHERASDLRTAAEEAGMPQLACDIDNARGWICGETIEDDR
jgi:hypothetical protein